MKDVEPSQLEALLNYMYKGEVNVLQDSLPGLIKAAEALKIKGLAVPDDGTNSNETSPSRERKRCTDFTSPREIKKSRKIENAKDNYKENISNRSTTGNFQNQAECLPSNEQDNISSHYSANYDDNASSKLTQNNISEYILQNSVKLEPVDRDEAPMDDILPKEESSGCNFTSLLPNNTCNDGEMERTDDHPLPLYQECFSETADTTNSVDMSWSTENAGTSNDQDFDVALMRSESPPSAIVSLFPHFFMNRPRETHENSASNSTRSGLYKHNCSFCSYGSYSSSAVRKHEMRIHTGVKPFKCSQCSYSCTTKESLRIHFRSHTGEKPYKCQYCSHKTTCYANLKKHVKSVHKTDEVMKVS